MMCLHCCIIKFELWYIITTLFVFCEIMLNVILVMFGAVGHRDVWHLITDPFVHIVLPHV